MHKFHRYTVALKNCSICVISESVDKKINKEKTYGKRPKI